MKQIKNSIAFLCVILLLAGLMALPAGAATLTNDWITLESDGNIAVSVYYIDDGSGEEPIISFVSPWGDVYSEGDGCYAEHYTDDDVIVYYIEDAPAGDWQIRYDSSFTGRLTVDAATYARDIWVDSFVMTSQNLYEAETEFFVSFPTDTEYDWTISAVTLDGDGNVSGSRELENGYAYANNTVTATVSLDALASFDEYYLLLEVSADDYGYTVTDSALTDSFAYDNPDSPEAVSGFYVMLNCATGEMRIDWEDAFSDVYATEYNVAVVADGTTVYANSFEDDIYSTEFIVDPRVTQFKVTMSYCYYDRVSEAASVTFSPISDGVEIATGELTSSAQAEITYSVQDDCFADIIINERSPERVNLIGAGNFSVSLDEGPNTVRVMQYLTDYVVMVFEKEIYSDRYAPALTFFENLNAITTSESQFVLIGQTDAGSTFTVNGVAHSLNSDGSFSVDLALSAGENVFEIVSADAAGNRASRQVTITCSNTPVAAAEDAPAKTGGSVLNWLPLIVTLVLSVAVAAVMLVLGRKKKLTLFNAMMMVLIACAIVLLVCLVMLIIQNVERAGLDAIVNGKEFYDLVVESPQKAYDHMIALEEAELAVSKIATVTWVVFGFTVAASIAFGVSCLLKKKKDNR